ncbi:NADH-quinone oxidoreductase subunit B [Desulfallas thermosapovorans]|uniref:NADH-quinone oxidoreductase subunit B n=1 Tax=Desulfallas thermosapovorans DSM 6562 TaxID=1121431 RepID=A0A5S4ZQN5_9FIRM|nr:NADH-quinone oxidoreductase subunit NuoB [Desulfallas thermosapovorans]TYO95178.1 NADH-quinone oxidoreductase subunit B [Desulfallas thermosapovorans DSM 6562]
MEVNKGKTQIEAVQKDIWAPEYFGDNPDLYNVHEVKRLVHLAPVEKVLNMARAHSIWPLGFGLACCAIEGLMAAQGPRYDLSRFGYEVLRNTARQADVMLVAGTVTTKAADFVVRLWEQMSEPKWCMAIGGCAISGGPFVDSYHVVPGVNKLVPVDVYVPGCPPRPDAVLDAFLMLRAKILDKREYLQRSKGKVVTG